MKNYELIISALKTWLLSAHQGLKQAAEKTAGDGLFSMNDIQHQLSVLRENVQTDQVEEWIKRSGLPPQNNATGKKVLCLHAGNLPLVGFQTALAVLLSGAHYYGKLSRKDPYLLASFLDEIKKTTSLQQNIEYSVDLNAFSNLHADKVVFAGSSDSIPIVRAEVARLKAARENADYIIRTAKFSVAYLVELNPDNLQQLAESALRYGGNGCRSVAVVVSPSPLEDAKEALSEKMQEFLKANPLHQKPKGNLFYQYAYNKAIGRPHIWLGDFLVQQSDAVPETNFTLNWVQGDADKVRELKAEYGDLLQTIYTAENTVLADVETEALHSAQRPPLWWKPDGMDVLRELCA